MEKEKSPAFNQKTDPAIRADHLPQTPGVYLMKDGKGTILYVGKAKNLRKRVRSYFIGEKDIKTATLLRKIKDIDYIVTETEYEALLLENNLIKQYEPKYNINLKDGKTYPVIRITAEEFPRVFRTRRIVRDGSEYYGPYPAVQALDTYLALIEGLYPLRKCRGSLKKRDTPCLYYHIGRCTGPCAGKIDREAYLKNVEGVRKLLSGDTGSLIADLEDKMAQAAKQQRFEEAARYRDLLKAIQDVEAQQRVEDFNEESRDYIHCTSRGRFSVVQVFRMRGGKLRGREIYLGPFPGTVGEVLEQFFLLYYTEASRVPHTIFLSEAEALQPLQEYVFRNFRRDTEVRLPSEKRDIAILNLVRENAEHELRKALHEEGDIGALEDLRTVLQLNRTPLRIEGFDVSQLNGKYPVASLVSFYRGVPEKQAYRKFHVKTLEGAIDDYEAMREIIARRYTRLLNEGKDIPDLILVDGGKGQVQAARSILNALGLDQIPLVGLAKREEELFIPDRKDPIILPEGSPALRVLQAVRDEAHRFATSFNKQLRTKALRLERLTSVPGIGEVRGKKLLKHFGSLESIAYAGTEEIAREGGVSLQVAEALVAYLKGSL
ncbi:MAG TPA: excinuclease ABC subunit UvrC [Spirochaetales bacterium]|nr:excinuclease ABC subunit UvrC [Spirochaetales bacterium]HOV37631.1 excinuclease ABC subunit UvrC [Spirochaetales bacterium]